MTSFSVSTVSKSFAIWGWLSLYIILISLLTDFFRYRSFIFSFKQILRATFLLFLLSVPKYTTAYAPEPIYLPRVQFSIEWLSEQIITSSSGLLTGLGYSTTFLVGVSFTFSTTLSTAPELRADWSLIASVLVSSDIV